MRAFLKVLSMICGVMALIAVLQAFNGGAVWVVFAWGALWFVLKVGSAAASPSKSNQLLMAASSESYGGASSDEVASLIRKGANVNALGVNGRPLHEATMWKRLDVVRALLEAGADPNGRNSDGWSALHVAANNDDTSDLIDLLVANGADVEARTKSGRTPLHIAAARLNSEAAQRLLSHGATVDAQDGDGQTALREVTRMLGVFSEPMILNGKQVSNEDEIRDCQEFATLLERHGARR